MAARTALIVGAGIGGLAAGIALRHAGWRVRILERAPEARALGFALSLAPNAVRALRELGLADLVIAKGCVVGRTELRGSSGRVLKRFDVATSVAGAASVFVLRPALHGTLLDATPPATLALNSEVIGFEASPTGVALTLADGRAEIGDVLVGADGIGSIVRRRLHPHEPPPRSSGYFGIRGVAYGAASHLVDLSVLGYLTRGIEAAAVRASADAVYWYLSLLAEDVPAVASGGRVSLERCASLLDRTFGAIVRTTKPDDVRLDELFDRKPIDDWGLGPVTLLGDAAHPMLPHTGQGAAQALEDAVALGLALGSDHSAVASLRKYEHVRSRRTAPIVRRGRRIARMTTTKSPVVNWLRAAAIRVLPGRAIAAGFLMSRATDPHAPLRTPA